MTLKIRGIYSPNFDSKRRKSNQIRFLIIHYTGMKREKSAIQRLSKIQSEVGTNYFIKKKWRSYNNGARFIYSMACWNFTMGKI